MEGLISINQLTVYRHGLFRTGGPSLRLNDELVINTSFEDYCQVHIFCWTHNNYLMVFFISGCQQVSVRVIVLAEHTINTLWFALSLAVSRFLPGSSLWLNTPLLPYGFLYGCKQVFVRIISLAGHTITKLCFSLSLAVRRFLLGSSL